MPAALVLPDAGLIEVPLGWECSLPGAGIGHMQTLAVNNLRALISLRYLESRGIWNPPGSRQGNERRLCPP